MWKLEVVRPAWFSEKFPTSRSRSKSSPPSQNSMTLGCAAQCIGVLLMKLRPTAPEPGFPSESVALNQKRTRHTSGNGKEATYSLQTSVHGFYAVCVCLYSLSRKVLLRFDKGLKFAAALSSWPCTCSAGPLQNKAIWVVPVQSKFLTMAYFGVSYSNIFSYNSLVPPAPILCVLYIVLCIISTNREIDRDR